MSATPIIDRWMTFLETVTGPSARRADLLREHGHVYKSVPWSSWRGTGYRRATPRRCYANAAKLARDRDELTYVEGLAANAATFAPVEHAWCVTDDGRVVEPTWRATLEGAGDVEDWEYLGVAVESDVVQMLAWTNVSWGVLNERAFDPDWIPPRWRR